MRCRVCQQLVHIPDPSPQEVRRELPRQLNRMHPSFRKEVLREIVALFPADFHDILTSQQGVDRKPPSL